MGLIVTKPELETLHEKLDKVLEYAARHDEHLIQLNGTIARHEKEFKNVYESFNKCKESHTAMMGALEKKIDTNSQSIWMGKGAIMSLGVITGISSVIAVIVNLVLGI